MAELQPPALPALPESGDIVEFGGELYRAMWTGTSFSGATGAVEFHLTLSPTPPETDWAAERQDVLDRFADELSKATGDGSKKRQSGEKPPWYDDPSHEAAMFSHLNKWKHGETIDPDSGAHPLVHLAWRALAIACSESGNFPVGEEDFE